MTSIKTQFSELRKNTPKHVLWLLMVAAFIVVLILLTLLLRGGKTDADKIINNTTPVLSFDPESVDWSDTNVGKTQNQKIIISANAPIKIVAVRLSKDVSGMAIPKTTCTNIGQINEKISCVITLDYAPTVPADTTNTTLFIDWRGASQSEKMNQTEKIIIVLGASVEKPIMLPAPTIAPEIEPVLLNDLPDLEPINWDLPEPEFNDNYSEPALSLTTTPENRPSEACSDFAFPGYNNSGVQIGWIKPERGRYNYHPFADKNCKSPAGVYNPDNGIITDINDPSKKIGTDAEHIGYTSIINGTIPLLSNPVDVRNVNRARQKDASELMPAGRSASVFTAPPKETNMLPSSFGSQATVSSRPHDRTFVLRQYKPIPATIVSEIRAVAGETRLPVTATVDRHVYSDNGRTIVIPAGTMMLGSVVGDMPGPYKAIGRISIEWYRFVRPDGVEFNFHGKRPFSGDAQGRTGVPGRGSTDYMEQFIMPMLTAVVPAAVNMISPIADKFINQIDLDNNTVTQTGQVRSSELAKNEIIGAWNKVSQKLLVDMMDNTVPPFSIASGTRITVFSPNDLIVTCGLENGKKCAITDYDNSYAQTEEREVTVGVTDPASLVGQVRSFNLDGYCDGKGGVKPGSEAAIQLARLDYRTVVFYCQSAQYTAINNAKQDAIYKNQQQTSLAGADGNKMQPNSKEYNESVLGLKYNEDGTILNPFQKLPTETPPAALLCEDGTAPDTNGCCTGETFTDMGEQGFNCCPSGGGDCFPPIQ